MGHYYSGRPREVSITQRVHCACSCAYVAGEHAHTLFTWYKMSLGEKSLKRTSAGTAHASSKAKGKRPRLASMESSDVEEEEVEDMDAEMSQCCTQDVESQQAALISSSKVAWK